MTQSATMPQRLVFPVRALLIAFIIQNTEEALFLPFWAIEHAPSFPQITISQFALVTALLTLLAVMVAVLSLRFWGAKGRLLLRLLSGMLLANALTHIAVSIATTSLMPGALSGVLLQGPAALWLLRRLCNDTRQIITFTITGALLQPVFTVSALAISAALLN